MSFFTDKQSTIMVFNYLSALTDQSISRYLKTAIDSSFALLARRTSKEFL